MSTSRSHGGYDPSNVIHRSQALLGCVGLGSRRGLRGPHDPALESADRLRAVCTQAYLASAIGGAEARVLPAAESDDVGAVHNDDEEPTYRRVWSSRRRRDRHAAAA